MISTASAIATFDEARRHPRTHLFVAATLYSDGGSAPVHVRNMSPTGALIESPIFPEVGAAVALKRGSLQLTGRIAWKFERKAGVAFTTTVCVSDWMARHVGTDQARVDEIISNFKTACPPDTRQALASPSSAGDSLESELLTVRAELMQLGTNLISDVILVATHPEIQMIDIAIQRVDRMLARHRVE